MERDREHNGEFTDMVVHLLKKSEKKSAQGLCAMSQYIYFFHTRNAIALFIWEFNLSYLQSLIADK